MNLPPSSSPLFPALEAIFGLSIAVGGVLLISRMSGWRQLARTFRAEREPEGATFKRSWVKMGIVSYGSVVILIVSHEGLYLKITPWFHQLFLLGRDHSPLLIPWSKMPLRAVNRWSFVRRHLLLFWILPPHLETEIAGVEISLPLKLLDAIKQVQGPLVF